MAKYAFKRVLQMIPLLLGVTFLSFALLRLAGSDAVLQSMDNTGIILSQESIQEARARLGLDRPFLVQYLSWLWNLLHGNMGTSYLTGQSVFFTFCSRLPATLILALTAMGFTLVISLPLGILAAVRQNRFSDWLIRCSSFLGNSLPGFFTGLLLMYLFSIRFGILPVLSRQVSLRSVILPGLTLAISMSSRYLRQVRAAVLDQLSMDYVTGAKARGVPFSITLWFSVLRSCMSALITLMGLSLGSLMGGTAVVESIFMWDGVGKLAVDAIQMRDYPVVLAYVVWMSLIYSCISLAADLLYGFLDPRIRLGEENL